MISCLTITIFSVNFFLLSSYPRLPQTAFFLPNHSIALRSFPTFRLVGSISKNINNIIKGLHLTKLTHTPEYVSSAMY